MTVSENKAKTTAKRGRRSKKDRIIEGFGLSRNDDFSRGFTIKSADDIADEVVSGDVRSILSSISRNMAKGLVGADRKARDSLERVMARFDDSESDTPALRHALSEIDLNSAVDLLAANETALLFALDDFAGLIVVDRVLRNRIDEIRRESAWEALVTTQSGALFVNQLLACGVSRDDFQHISKERLARIVAFLKAEEFAEASEKVSELEGLLMPTGVENDEQVLAPAVDDFVSDNVASRAGETVVEAVPLTSEIALPGAKISIETPVQSLIPEQIEDEKSSQEAAEPEQIFDPGWKNLSEKIDLSDLGFGVRKRPCLSPEDWKAREIPLPDDDIKTALDLGVKGMEDWAYYVELTYRDRFGSFVRVLEMWLKDKGRDSLSEEAIVVWYTLLLLNTKVGPADKRVFGLLEGLRFSTGDDDGCVLEIYKLPG